MTSVEKRICLAVQGPVESGSRGPQQRASDQWLEQLFWDIAPNVAEALKDTDEVFQKPIFRTSWMEQLMPWGRSRRVQKYEQANDRAVRAIWTPVSRSCTVDLLDCLTTSANGNAGFVEKSAADWVESALGLHDRERFLRVTGLRTEEEVVKSISASAEGIITSSLLREPMVIQFHGYESEIFVN